MSALPSVRRTVRYVRGEARVYGRTWRGSVAGAFIAPLLYLGGFGFGVGALVQRQGSDLPGGVAYSEFVAPGLLAATVFLLMVSQALWPSLAAIQWRGTWSAALATPLGVDEVVAGRIAWLGVRGAIAGGAYGVATVLLGLVEPARALLMVAPAVLTGMALGSLVLAMTCATSVVENLSLAYRFGVVPLFLLSGSFFPVERLPDPIETAARILPVWHGVELTRAAALGIEPGAPWWLSTAYLAALVPVGWWLGSRALARRLTP